MEVAVYTADIENHTVTDMGCDSQKILLEQLLRPVLVESNTQPVVAGLVVPWSVAFLPDSYTLVPERFGRLVTDIYNDPQLVPQPIAIVEPGFSFRFRR